MSSSQLSTLDSSARRIELAKAGGRMILDKPFFGVGFGHFRVKSIGYNPYLHSIGGPGLAHSFYIEIMAETGLFSIILILLIIVFSIITLHSVQKIESLSVYSRGIEGAILSFIVTATFLSALNTKFNAFQLQYYL